MDPARLIALINEAMRKRDIPIGKIDVQRNFSFFEIDRAWDQKLLQAFDGAVYEDQPVVVEIKNQKMQPSSRPGSYKGSAKKKHRKGKKRQRV